MSSALFSGGAITGTRLAVAFLAGIGARALVRGYDVAIAGSPLEFLVDILVFGAVLNCPTPALSARGRKPTISLAATANDPIHREAQRIRDAVMTARLGE